MCILQKKENKENNLQETLFISSFGYIIKSKKRIKISNKFVWKIQSVRMRAKYFAKRHQKSSEAIKQNKISAYLCTHD